MKKRENNNNDPNLEEKSNMDINEELDETADSNQEAVKEELEKDSRRESNASYEAMYEEKVKEYEELNSRYLRLQADFTNYKKRTEKEKEGLFSYANQEIIGQLLLVVDNFERALGTGKAKVDEGFFTGVEMVYNQLIDILKNNGLEEISALGEKFDPNLHHGVAQGESDEYDEDTVIEIFQKGYKLKDRVIRPAMVKISK